MKATKIVGAILGIFMVAALFTGAVAADTTDNSLGTVYVNALYAPSYFTQGWWNQIDVSGDWTNVETGKTISFTPEEFGPEVGSLYYMYIADNAKSAEESTVVGKYYKDSGMTRYFMDVKYPTVSIKGTVYKYTNNIDFGYPVPVCNLADGTATTADAIEMWFPTYLVGWNDTAVPGQPIDDAPAKLYGIALINPDGDFVEIINDIVDFDNETGIASAYTDLEGYETGTWTIKPVFVKGNNYGFATVAPTYMYGDGISLTITKADTSKTITASKEEITQGSNVVLTLTAPMGFYLVSVNSDGYIPLNQPSVFEAYGYYGPTYIDYPDNYAIVYVDVNGETSFTVKSISSSDMKVTLYDNIYDTAAVKKQITIKVKPGAITATASADSVYIGDEFDLEGVNDLGGNVYFYIKGTNYPLEFYWGDNGVGKEWDATIDTGDLTNPDAGIYTIYIAQPTASNTWYQYLTDADLFDDAYYFNAYTTVSVSLIQPFITANVASEVVVQGDKLNVYGNAEGNPKEVSIYVFGTNFFKFDNASVLDDGTYTYSKKILGTDKEANGGEWKMAAGQYFLVVQHPMYDDDFNIYPVPAIGLDWSEAQDAGNFDITLAEAFEDGEPVNPTTIFNTLKRQSSNAAEALIQAIGSQNIDDMQAHLSFIVAGPTSVVNAIPSQVVKGQDLVISGTTTGHANEMVTVELLSTAFAAVPKETVGSAAFATVSTRIGEDGVWTVTFDTSNLNCDDYTVAVAVGQLDPVTAKTKIVEGSTPVTPTAGPSGQPTVAPSGQPTTTPATPGFGALAALVGLGAVAVLLLRRE